VTISRYLPVDRAQQRQDAMVKEITHDLPGLLDLRDAHLTVPAVAPSRATDPAFDGAIVGATGVYSPTMPLDRVESMQPNNGAQVKASVILINGIMTDLAIHQADMQALANTGCQVVGIRNATHGMVMDLVECLRNKLNVDDTPAVHTTVRLLAQALERGQPVHLVGHSQGALIIARSLQVLRDNMLQVGLTTAQAGEKLGLIKVETFGGASNTFVDGPKYRHVINSADLVPMLMGVGLDRFNPVGHAGKGAEFRKFTEVNMPRNLPPLSGGVAWSVARAMDQSVHGPRDVYFKYRNSGG